MCGRYAFFSQPQVVTQELGAVPAVHVPVTPRYNAAPSQFMPVITSEFPLVLQPARWGLVPQWAKDMQMGNRLINTRSESIREKPAFYNIFRFKRCLVPADCYFEWKQEGKLKVPYCIHHHQKRLLYMAGLWDLWHEELVSFSVITTGASDDIRHLHHRMPVLLQAGQAALWLDRRAGAERLLPLLKAAPEGYLRYYSIGTKINTPVHDDASLLAPVNHKPNTLFD
jgi:putative SOS response-associated peptidase YedK